MDEVNAGSATEPCDLTLYPDGGSYILMARTEKLSDENGVGDIVMDIKKCPVSDFVEIFISCGLSAELDGVPPRLRTAKNFGRPLVRIVKKDMDGARRALHDITNSASTTSKKRKAAEDASVDASDIPEKSLKKVIRKLKCTKAQAVTWLRENELDPDTTIFNIQYRIHQEGYAEDI